MNHYIVPCNLYKITQQLYFNKSILEDFPGGPVVKNLPHNAGDAGSIPDWGTKIPHASEQLQPLTLQLENLSATAKGPI